MFRSATLILCVTLTLCTATTLSAGNWHGKYKCEKIKDGTIFNSDGEVIETGFDDWGYNYQAHMFVGSYCDAYNDADWCQEYVDIILYMKWNDAWISNKDCDGDGALDRHYGHDTYIGSGARLTNLQKGTYIDDNGDLQRWMRYYLIKAAPSNARLEDGIWYKPNGRVLGPEVWGEFIIVRNIFRDTGITEEEDSNVTTQSMRIATEPIAPMPYVDPYSVDFDQFTPQD